MMESPYFLCHANHWSGGNQEYMVEKKTNREFLLSYLEASFLTCYLHSPHQLHHATGIKKARNEQTDVQSNKIPGFTDRLFLHDSNGIKGFYKYCTITSSFHASKTSRQELMFLYLKASIQGWLISLKNNRIASIAHAAQVFSTWNVLDVSLHEHNSHIDNVF